MIRKIDLNDAEYPANLKNIHRPPKTLFVNGSLVQQDAMAVALVGSRRASIYGMEACEKLAFELAARGVTIVSGMARGIDTAAHRGALKAKGRTIAVMGSGHGNIYPPENAGLYKEIVNNGAVVTEFEDDVAPMPKNFPQRNRIISGLSLGVVVVEAARNSGALITANFAAEQGREVFAVPGKISTETSSGTNALIKDGAKLVQSVDDILEELSLKEVSEPEEGKGGKIKERIGRMTQAYIYNAMTEPERAVYNVLSDEPLHVDEVAVNSGSPQAKALQALLGLQLKGVVKELPGKKFIKIQ